MKIGGLRSKAKIKLPSPLPFFLVFFRSLPIDPGYQAWCWNPDQKAHQHHRSNQVILKNNINGFQSIPSQKWWDSPLGISSWCWIWSPQKSPRFVRQCLSWSARRLPCCRNLFYRVFHLEAFLLESWQNMRCLNSFDSISCKNPGLCRTCRSEIKSNMGVNCIKTIKKLFSHFPAFRSKPCRRFNKIFFQSANLIEKEIS